jgi:CDP-glucose 4,6-dehydratase
MEGLAVMDPAAFRGKRVLVTGHTGFKGAWLAIWLEKLGAHVIGVALDPEVEDCLYSVSRIGDRIRDLRCDIRNGQQVADLMAAERPEIVLHLAAQALVLESYRSPIATFDVNVMGTAHMLEAIRRTPSVKAAVMVTTDKCYENREQTEGYKESDALGGHDPYSASKGAAEIVIASYRRSFFSDAGSAGIASARSGNVVGGGDWSADRIVPDLVRAVEAGLPLTVRNPGSVRPWQHVLEPLHGYLLLTERLLSDPRGYAEAWNFGPAAEQVHTVRDLVDAILQRMGKGAWHEAEGTERPHEARLLMLNIDKATRRLGWRPKLSYAETVRMTAEWYMARGKKHPIELCREQIDQYYAIGSK